MINYETYINKLKEYHLINPIYLYLLDFIEEELKDNIETYLTLFSIYFSLLSEGNVCMSLDKEKLLNKWNEKLSSTFILLNSKCEYNEEKYNSFKEYSISIIDNYLQEINETNLPNLIGDNKIFVIDNNWLYLKKYNDSRLSIIKSIKRLFNKKLSNQSIFDYKKYVIDSFCLSNGQIQAVNDGICKDLIITGGPGCGKTTSILFLLINLLLNDFESEVYLVAPSGKASSRMKESIINGLSNLNDDFKNKHPKLIEKINNLQESTIHRLIGIDFDGKYKYNKNKQFKPNSIFIIDEASMIDICMFDALLQAIPSSARIFMMGDKNQLPSVECGAVFSDLLNAQFLQDNIIELDESIRFSKDTKIFELANAINTGAELPVNASMWNNSQCFEIKQERKDKPIYYYIDNNEHEKEDLSFILQKWGECYFKDLQKLATSIDITNIDYLDMLYNKIEESKILCAENETIRGVNSINQMMIKSFINKKVITSLDNYFPGEIMMVKKNNNLLSLYNGDSGLLVTIKGDHTLYFMVKKSSISASKDGYVKNNIFKIASYVFYPLRMISQKEIDFAYAITIHKSQGSDYKNILVILPKQLGHPLINRQIVYTAITRTKGNTYLFSSQPILEAARDTLIQRDTNIDL